MIEVRKPRLLVKQLQTGTNILKEAGRLSPLKQSYELNLETLSRAELTLSENDLAPVQHQFIEIYGARGSVGIYRVVSKSRKIKNSRTYQLNHAFDVFHDCVIPGTEKIEGTVTQVLTRLVNCQKEKIGNQYLWQLGTVSCNDDYEFDNSYNNVLEEMWNIAEDNKGYYFSFDFTTFPWTLNFVKKNSAITGTLRLNRNIDDIEINESDNEQCTKLYLSIDTRDDSKVPKSQQGVTYRTITDDDAIAEWGVIEKAEGIETKEVGSSEAKIQKWINRYMNEHKNPELTITITGEEYARITGESQDQLYLGRICATILSEYSTIFHERVVSLKFPDALRKPLHFEASLANKKITAGGSIAKINKKARRSGAAQKKKNDALGHRIEETDQHWQSMYWDGYNGLTSRIEQTAAYWQAEFVDMYNGLHSFIEITAQHFQTEFDDMYNGFNSRLEQTAAYWRSEISNMYSGLSSRVEQTEHSWSTTVQAIGYNGQINAGTIALAINNAGESEAHINADKVYIGNSKSTTVIAGKCELSDVTADYIGGKIATLAILNTRSIYASSQISTGGYVYADDFVIGSSTGGPGNKYVHNAITELQLVGPTNNTYTLQKKDFNDSEWVDVGTFERSPSTTVTMAWNGSTGSSAGASNNITGTAAVGGASTEYVKLSAVDGTIYLKAGSDASTVAGGGGTVVAKITDVNLVPGNIKNGVTIFGKTGTYTGSATTVSMTWNGSTGSSAGASNNITGAAAIGGSKTVYVKMSSSSGTIYLKAGEDSSTVAGGGGTVVGKLTDSNLKAANIKSGVTIFGVEGSYGSFSWGEKQETSSEPSANKSYGATYVSKGSTLWIKITVTANGTSRSCKFKCVGA